MQDRFPKDTGVAIVFAYFRYADHYSTRDILASLVKQLVELSPSLPSYVEQTYDDHKRKATCLSEDEMLGLFLRLLQLFTRVYVVLDALDEMSDNYGINLVNRLSSIPVHLLLTSRPLDLSLALPEHTTTLHIGAQTERDIELFITKNVEDNLLLRRLLQGDETLRFMTHAKLKEKSQGMYVDYIFHPSQLTFDT